jgi:hypothetical protein
VSESKQKEPALERLNLASCDSQTLMWAFPWGLIARSKKASASNKEEIAEKRLRARMLLKILDRDKVKIIVPSIVVAELLIGVDLHRHTKVLMEFNKQFFCPPFDVSACSLAAGLWQFERGLPGENKGGLPENDRSLRKTLKSDILIVASAKIAGATTFYSDDKSARRLATEAGMEGKGLPTTSGDWILDWESKVER